MQQILHINDFSQKQIILEKDQPLINGIKDAFFFSFAIEDEDLLLPSAQNRFISVSFIIVLLLLRPGSNKAARNEGGDAHDSAKINVTEKDTSFSDLTT
ncbi:hypothetical protein [Paenibacillus macquariensis]|uniref:Uncharacterized protein n=1 Tax=Paenibacillus macquariensis TaxID=948756 RepID=A0ABY1JTV9_9BACL|nr:hypothetical protein [Paenibacillus macquariensis]MEC0091055.1 hypothetical protein [Paenibacillus macquariensis]SIQ77704.1 hypothetical protein SAMN05421578_1042 [Paenibacillus macquariensis]